MRFIDLLSKFSQVDEHTDGGYIALCPAHADSNPSLRIWRGDDLKVRITCRAGCAPESVLKSAGLVFSDLFNASGDGLTVPKEPPTLVSGNAADELILYASRRNLEFQRQATDAAKQAAEYVKRRFGMGYISAGFHGLGVDDGTSDDFPFRSRAFKAYPRVTVPLYDFEGIPRGLQGRDITGKCPARWVSISNPKGQRWAAFGVFRGDGQFGATIVTEGPGDALCAAAVGYDSVAVRGAALASSAGLVAELARGLTGTQVIVCGDQDSAGQGFVKRLSDGLRAYGITVYVLRLPTGFNDLSAWLEASPETFASGLHNAVKAAEPLPSAIKAQASAELAKRTGAGSVSLDQGEAAARIIAEMLSQYDGTDTMNAHALVAWADGTIRYAPGLGFYVWNGRHWERGDVRVRQEIHRLGAALVLAGKLKEARGFTMTTNIDNLMTELRSVPSVYVTPDEFDARRHLLSFRNCTVDLRTGESHPHDKADMITFCVDVDYRPDAKCPRWEAFLDEIFVQNPELVPYAQRLVGYGVTGSTDEQCFVVLYGKGANGKSVFTDTLTSVFGAITQTTRFATFEEKPGGAIPNDLAALRNARLVMASEGKAGRVMDESVLKSVTGKDKVTARFLHKEFFTYSPQFLILLATNHKPNFVSQDEGMWRRVKLVPFTRWFAPQERDYDLDRKLKAEAEGIAVWAVRGAIEWYKHGLGDPKVIVNETREYRETSDTLAGFFPGVIEREDGAHIPGAEAYNEYQAWCEEEGLRGKDVKSRTLFYRMMEERGVSKRKTNAGIVLEGVKLAQSRDVTMRIGK